MNSDTSVVVPPHAFVRESEAVVCDKRKCSEGEKKVEKKETISGKTMPLP